MRWRPRLAPAPADSAARGQRSATDRNRTDRRRQRGLCRFRRLGFSRRPKNPGASMHTRDAGGRPRNAGCRQRRRQCLHLHRKRRELTGDSLQICLLRLQICPLRLGALRERRQYDRVLPLRRLNVRQRRIDGGVRDRDRNRLTQRLCRLLQRRHGGAIGVRRLSIAVEKRDDRASYACSSRPESRQKIAANRFGKPRARPQRQCYDSATRATSPFYASRSAEISDELIVHLRDVAPWIRPANSRSLRPPGRASRALSAKRRTSR